MSSSSIRDEYEKHGARGYYEQFGGAYRNPQEEGVGEALAEANLKWALDLSNVLDLACGSGEVTLGLLKLGAIVIKGVDPYTWAAYQERTGQGAESHSFEQIAAGALDGQRFSLIVCSFAMHLMEPARLPGLLFRLGRIAPRMLILTPHKRPYIKESWGWRILDEFVVNRVRARFYASGLYEQNVP